jgi:hypothetical protein
MMKKPKPRHLKKEIAKQVRAIQIQMGLTPRQMRAMTALKEMRDNQRLQQLADTAVHLDPMNFGKTASRLSMLPVSQARQEMFEQHDVQNRKLLNIYGKDGDYKPFPDLTSQTPLTSEEAYDVLYGGIDAELGSTVDKSALPLGRPNPLREHWEKYGDQDTRVIPGQVNVDALLDQGANPELRQHVARLMATTNLPFGLSDPGRAEDRDFTKLAVKATPEQIAEMGKDMKLVFKDGVQVAGTGWSVDHDGDVDHIPPKKD